MIKIFWFVLFSCSISLWAGDIEVISKDKGVLSSRELSRFKELFQLHSFIETGTYSGDTTAEASKIFDEVHSVEIWEPLYHRAQERFAQTPNVHLYLGDTTRLLAQMVQKSAPKRLYWLDAHSSGDGTGGTPGFSPILMELDQIYSANDLESVVLIDDLRGMCHCDSRTNLPLRQIIQKLKDTDAGLRFYSIGDIGIIFNEKTYPSITVSEIVKSASISRFFDPEIYDESVFEELIRAESFIASIKEGSQEEKNFSQLMRWVDRNCLGGEVIYLLWGALQKLDRKEYASAIEDFHLISKSFYSHWRIDAYLVKALMLDGQLDKARLMFNEKLKDTYERHPELLSRLIPGLSAMFVRGEDSWQ
jgi:hypothetical protein